MSRIRITKTVRDARHGRYVATLEDREGEAELTFTRRGENLISADHTGVPNSMAGQGVARALYDFMVNDARTHQFRIIPLCPFVKKQFERDRRDPKSDIEQLFKTDTRT